MLIDPSRGVSLAGAASPPLEFAIGELTDTLSAMSGRPVPRVQKDAAVTVGRRSAFGAAGLPRADGFDGYAISAGPDGVRIAGDNERGCIYGVYDLLERLGCLWLAPDQDPLDPPHIPKSDRLDVPEGAWAVASPVRWRVCNASSWFFEMDTDIAIRQMDWGMKLRYNTMGWQAENRTPLLAQYQILKDSGVLRELTRRGMMLHGPAHSFDHFLPNELFEEHPEWFGMRDGARVKQVFGGAQFCWSNPDARRAFVDNAEAFALAVPELSVFCTLGFDGGPCCQCPRCAASEPADLVMGLMAELAERLAVSRPGLPVETSGGYNPVHEPPQNARIHKDVRVVWAHWGRWHGEGYSDASYAWKDNLELWRDAVDGRLTLTQYYTDNFAEPWVAAPYSRAIVGDRKWVLENGVDTLKKCTKDTIVVGHDLEKDMAWDLVPPNGNNDDGHAPVFVLLDTLVFGKDVVAPLDAMTEIIELLSKKGRNDFWRGFKSFKVPGQGKTKNYSFGVTLYGNPNNGHKAKIPLIYDIRPLR